LAQAFGHPNLRPFFRPAFVQPRTVRMGQKCCSSATDPDELANMSTRREEEETFFPASAPVKESGCKSCRYVCCSICCVLIALGVVVGLYMAKCVMGVLASESIVLPLAKDLPPYAQRFTLAEMSVGGALPVKKWEEKQKELEKKWTTETGYTFGYATPGKAAHLLYEGSKVDGIWEHVPEQFKGVYWMKGNPLPEVLAVIQYAKWFEKEKTLLMANAPWTWAWYGGEKDDPPSDLSFIGDLTYRFMDGRALAESYVAPSGIDTLVSFRFEDCPADTECKEGSSNLTYAELMSHPDGNLTTHGMSYYDGYTMEEYPHPGSAEAGSVYFRRASMFCGLFGAGSGYNLTKVIDGDGKPLEPYHSQYLAFMNDRPLIIWSGMPAVQG